MRKKNILSLSILFISLFSIQSVSAQDWKDWFNQERIKDVVSNVAAEFIDFSIIGTWNYTGSAIKLESSSNKLADIGSVAASSTIEGKLNEQLQKVGIQPGTMNFQFKEDSTMIISIGSKTYDGTFSYNADAKELKMKIANKIPITTNVEVRNSDFSVLFEADALLSIIKRVSGSIDIKYLETVCKLLENFDGMKVGFNFEEQD